MQLGGDFVYFDIVGNYVDLAGRRFWSFMCPWYLRYTIFRYVYWAALGLSTVFHVDESADIFGFDRCSFLH